MSKGQMPEWMLTIFFGALLLLFGFILFSNFIASSCDAHTVGYQMLCKMVGRDW